ncbi:MAG: HIT family protein [Roseivivax sp.]|nr:HIT family protein [Roseivivax sp.]
MFCDIASGRTAAHVVAQSRALLAVADPAPIRPGHLQVLPRAHHDSFDTLPPALAAQIVKLGQRLAQAQKAEFGVARVAFVFTGCDVAHAHAHLVPMHAGTDITSARYIAGETPRFAQLPLASAAALRGTAQALRARLEGAMA